MAIVLIGLGIIVLAATLFTGLVGIRRHEQARQGLEDLDTEAARAELARRASRRAWRAE